MPARCPFVRFHRTTSFAETPQPCLRRPTFSVAPEKVGKKMRLETRYIARCRARFSFDALFGRRIAIFPKLSLPTNVLHAVTGRLHQFRFCSFPEYSTGRCRHRPLQTYPKSCLGGRLCLPVPLKIRTIGANVDAFCIPRQRVLLSSCVATVSDGSVVPTQAAL